ncbi:GTPase IMAP family member 8-like [Triplophysa rosa]|uniref:Plectin-like n=1 Tax=Triplophysa rosa TaxID=992332 RepID=A0A9W8C8L3_TRIRA|nr:GTPase IMAP family member 8-like [Triplophysa rosa]KAI7810702.1 putative plectin-like [Triplophysa rosa]
MAGATDSSDLRISLLGKNGAEISSVGNMILGREAFKEKSRVSEVQRGRADDRNISVIDTPGFFSTELTDEDLQNEMMKSLSLSHPGPHVFLLIVNPDTFTEDDVTKIIQNLEKNFGVQVFRFTRVLFIKEQMSNRDWIAFSLTKKFKELISHFKSKYYVINSESETITRLLEKMNDMVKQNDNQHYIIDNYVKFIPQKKQEQKEKVQMQTDRKLPLTPPVTSPVTRPHEHQPQPRPRDRKLPLTPPVTSPVHEKHENKAFGVIHQPHTRPQDLRMVMFGTSGNGKSASGNTILGRDLFKVEMCCGSVTTLSETHQNTVDGRNISVTDNPGLFDTSMTTEHLNSEIVNCLYKSAPGPHVFLLIIRLDVKYTEELKDMVKWIQEVFSEDAMNYTMVLFTRGDQLDEPIQDFLKRNKQLKDLVDQCKAGYHVFNNKDRNRRQVTELFEKIDRLVERNGGEHYTNELYQEAQRKADKEQERKKEKESRKCEKQRKTEEQRDREEELRNLEKELRNREEQVKNREEQLRQKEEEQRKREEEQKLKRISAETRAKELVRNMSMRRKAALAALIANMKD